MTTTSPKSSQRRVERLTSYSSLVLEALTKLDELDAIKRMWQRDCSLWKTDEAHQKIIANSLGWLNVAVPMRKKAEELVAFADEIRTAGFTDVLLLGMGGSSLCPEVFRQVFGSRKGYPALHVLDCTVPAQVAAFAARLDLTKTLVIVASKSGSTIEPQMFFRFFLDEMKKVKGDAAGENFVAITDPGTMMENQAREAKFRKIILNPADIGGRFSALSNFGMLPAALIGVDIRVLLDRALHSVNFCSFNTPIMGMPGARRGAALGALAQAGRDKVTLVIQPELASLGLWIEQLVAESTGKEGVGILPICGEALGDPGVYGDDRVFVLVHDREYDDPAVEAKLDRLTEAGHPSLRIILNEHISIGEELFLWEFATALAGVLLAINPFDQPNVQESKTNSVAIIEEYKKTGVLPEPDVLASEGGLVAYGRKADWPGVTSVANAIKALVKTLKPRDYFAVMQFVEESPVYDEILQDMRTSVRDAKKVATTTGYGPRFLHSTGQFHKGGGDNGVFLQVTADDAKDVAIPGEPFSFGVLVRAQAIGDFQSLLARDRRALRIHIKGPVREGLKAIRDLVKQAL